MANQMEPQLARLLRMGSEVGGEYTRLQEIARKKELLEGEMTSRRALYQRWDNLYYPQQITTGGPDHWPEGAKAGRVHVSINVHPVYVDVPADLMARTPIVNYIPTGVSKAEREASNRREILFREWWDRNDMDAQCHEIGVVRGLYGIGYWKVRWDPIEKLPGLSVIDQPGNMYVGWGNSEYTRMDWAIYCYGLSPQAAEEDFGVTVAYARDNQGYLPITSGDHADPLNMMTSLVNQASVPRSDYAKMQVEVYDYWYKVPKGAGKQPEIWNCVYVGNTEVKNDLHPELNDLPFIPVRNGKIPGSPWGKSELYDIEQTLREKDERMSEGGELLHGSIAGQRWQLTGPEAPDEVPENAIPKPGKVAAPGAGNRLEPIQPVVLQFQLEDYLKRLDRELVVESGLNDYLLGSAPAQVLSSSKAMNALTANYEGRIELKRKQLYDAIRVAWRLCASMWERKNPDVKSLIDGNYRIQVVAPDLTPRDALETAQMEINAVNSRLHSMERAMDAMGVDNPTDEKALIREEQTDASLQPAAVQTQVTLLAALRALNQPLPTSNQLQNTNRQLNQGPAGSQSLNASYNQANPPPEAQAANAPQNPNAPAAGLAPGGPIAQAMVQGGQAKGRILSQTPIGKP